jgi:outer membrane protein OmpA-like peptidoglycan-associated protein/tetratricopeptide (TPR) repeat protein
MKNLLASIIILFSVFSFGQSKRLWLKFGDEAFLKKDYPSAIAYYTKVLDDTTIMKEMILPYEVQIVNLKTKEFKQDTTRKNSGGSQSEITKSDYLNHQLAHAYRLNYDYQNALNYFKVVTDNGSYPGDKYYYGLALINVKKYDQAMTVFEKLLNESKTDSVKKLIQKSISSCYFALDTNSNKKLINVKKLDTIVFNAGTSNFAPMYWNSSSKLLFTSARKGGVILDPEKQDSRYLCDLYYTELKDTGWMKPVNFGRPVNTGLHEGSCVISSDEIMFFTRWSDANRKEAFVYMAKMKDGLFYEAYKLSETVNQVGYKAMQPYVSFDGTKLFFSSNKPGGYGGFDLYMCNIDENGLTGEARNLGPVINTTRDEVTPFYHTISNTLFFSSDGHVGIGGLDIFKSSLNTDDSIYIAPKNLGTPINSSKDDSYFILDRIQTKGYFSSDREDCPGGNCYDIYEFENEPITFDISGVVTDYVTYEPIPSALITIRDVSQDDEPIFLITDDKGFYSTPLKENKQFFIKAQKKGYQASAASATTKGLTETTHLVQDFVLDVIPGNDIVIEGIEYDLNKTTLRPKSMEILDKIYDYLILNDNFSIEINAHTDTRGSEKANKILSQGRAQSCVTYLINKGIEKDRLLPTGYGETRPLVSDAEIAKLIPNSPEFEAAHQKNRRTAFRVMQENTLIKEIKKK